MSEAPQITNPGRSEVIERRHDLAEAIAANITSGREAAPEPAPEPKPEPAKVDVPEQATEPEPSAEAAPEETPDVTEETPDRFTLADFAEAADLDVDTLIERLDVTVPGKSGEERANLAEVLNGYRWNAANTQRAQENAEQRRQADERLESARKLHDQAQALINVQWADVNAAEQALEQQYRAMPWEQLRARGDGSYADAEAQFQRQRNEIENQRRKLAGAYEQVQNQRREMLERQRQEELPRQRAELLERIPEWRDEARFTKESRQVAEDVANRYGFESTDFDSVTDPRIIHMIRDLWSLQTQAGDADLAAKEVKKAPRMMKPGQRQSRESGKQQKMRKLRSELKKSGHRRDLAAMVLENMRR